MVRRGSGAAGQRGSTEPLSEPLARGRAAPLPRFVDLSHTIHDGMVTYPGLPGPLICDYLSREASRGRYGPGVEFQIGKIEMVANTGTYIDAPFHRYADGKDLAQLPLESLADLEAVVIRARGSTAVDRRAFEGLPLQGKAVLVETGWDAHWGSQRYLSGSPFVTADAAAYLVDQGAALVGIDSLNIDDVGDSGRPVHSTLLGAQVPIVEHLCNLAALPDRGSRFFAVPARVVGMGSWPVRAFSVVRDEWRVASG